MVSKWKYTARVESEDPQSEYPQRHVFYEIFLEAPANQGDKITVFMDDCPDPINLGTVTQVEHELRFGCKVKYPFNNTAVLHLKRGYVPGEVALYNRFVEQYAETAARKEHK
jgi:hypothetical protein